MKENKEVIPEQFTMGGRSSSENKINIYSRRHSNGGKTKQSSPGRDERGNLKEERNPELTEEMEWKRFSYPHREEETQ